MKVKNLPKKIYLNICSNEEEVDYNELDGVTFSTEKVGVTDCDTENVPYVNAASLWHDLKEENPPLKKLVMFRYSGRGVNPTSIHHGAMSDDGWIVTRGDGTHRIEALYECYDKIEWLDFDELKYRYRMTNEEFCKAHIGERVLYKGKDIGAYVAGYVEEKYIILGFDDYTGCIQCFTSKVKNLCGIYNSYRFAKLKYLEVIKHQ